MPTTHIVREAVDKLVTRARREIDEGLLPSCQLALALDGEVVEQVTLGDHLGDDSRYATFSAIKGVVYTAPPGSSSPRDRCASTNLSWR